MERKFWRPRTDVFRVEPRVLVDNSASTRHTIFEVNGRDRPGLLYEMTRALQRLELTIVSTLVSTFGESAVDVFYVKDSNGRKLTDRRAQEMVRAELLSALTLTDEALTSAAAG